MTPFVSPLRYPGGKSRIFPFISRLLQENQLIGIHYAEPYAGGAGLALQLLYDEYVDRIYINDKDPSILAFWKAITNNADAFCAWIESVPIDIETWRYYKNIHSNRSQVEYYELGKATFYLNRTNISGVITGGPIGGKAQAGKYKLNARFNKSELIMRIQKVFSFRHRISVSGFDGITFIKRLAKQDAKLFIYLDPPYVLKGCDLYMNYYEKADHIKLASYIKKLDQNWMISYDDNEFILALYKEQNRIRYQLSQCTSNRVGNEILALNNNLAFANSITKLKSANVV